MSEELDRRAAKAMGWKQIAEEPWFWVDNNGMTVSVGMEDDTWSPSTDRNDLAELLKEVERRDCQGAFTMKVMHEWPARPIGSLYAFSFWLLTADPAIICEAACEVLEAK